MTLDEQKRLEDKITQLLAGLSMGEKAILYKTLYAQGLKIADCDTLIRKAVAPVSSQDTREIAAQVHLARGIPPFKFP